MNDQQKQQLASLQEVELDLLAEKRVLDEHLAALQRELDRNRTSQRELLEADDSPACPHCLDRYNAQQCGPGHIDAGFGA
jgi:hypothetical protein